MHGTLGGATRERSTMHLGEIASVTSSVHGNPSVLLDLQETPILRRLARVGSTSGLLHPVPGIKQLPS